MHQPLEFREAVSFELPRIGGSPVSYDIGWYSKHSGGTINFTSPTYLAGAFGAPNALPGAVTTPNPAYVLKGANFGRPMLGMNV